MTTRNSMLSKHFESDINKYSTLILEPGLMQNLNKPVNYREKNSPTQQLRLRKLTENRQRISSLVEQAKNVIKPSMRQRVGASTIVFHKDDKKSLRLPDIDSSILNHDLNPQKEIKLKNQKKTINPIE